VLLPAPDEGPALTIYQEAGQFLDDQLTDCSESIFDQKAASGDSKTGRGICL
jgi:hypothetical protein